ncbi:hypothetical protein C7S15_2319 [Burkholderia cepacia]|nr:hypothetical protein [Burkholderia cepacia]
MDARSQAGLAHRRSVTTARIIEIARPDAGRQITVQQKSA